MEKYGFVYIWRDRKHKRYYIGAHWGTETDGYVCSSNWMKMAQKRRPQDFKRRILSRIHTNRHDMLTEEHRWLQMIPDQQLGKNYYNFNKYHFGHWTSDEIKRNTISEKISKAFTDERKQKMRESKLGDKNPMKNAETIAKRLKTYRKGNHQIWNKGLSVDDSRVRNNIKKSLETKKTRQYTIWNKGKSKPLDQRMKQSKYWTITKPSGEIITVQNLNIFCTENNLTQANMIAIANGKRKQHKGYRCSRA